MHVALKTIWQNDTLAITEKEDLTALLLSGHNLSYIRLDNNIHDHRNEFHDARYASKFGVSRIDFFGRAAQAIKKGSNGMCGHCHCACVPVNDNKDCRAECNVSV